MIAWSPAEDLAAPLNNPEPTDYDVVGLFAGTDAEIAARFAVMSACPHHRFRAHTDELARAGEWFAWADAYCPDAGGEGPARMLWDALTTPPGCYAVDFLLPEDGEDIPEEWTSAWPLPNLMLGITIHTQAEAATLALQAALPARFRFVRVEPIEAIDLRRWLVDGCPDCGRRFHDVCSGGLRLDLVEIAGGAGPEQLRLVQDIGRLVLEAQTWGTCTYEDDGVGCVWGSLPEHAPIGGTAPRCPVCAGEGQQLVAGPALAIVAAPVCERCEGYPSGTYRPLGSPCGRSWYCDECNGAGAGGGVRANPEIWIAGRRHQNQQPVGWRS